MANDLRDYWHRAIELLNAETSFVVVTLVRIRGSAPQVVGAKAIITADGINFGTVGGGAIEAAAIRHAQQMLQANHPAGPSQPSSPSPENSLEQATDQTEDTRRRAKSASDAQSGQRSASHDLVTWNLQTDIGMTCGGEVQLFFEVHASSSWSIAVFGAGHVAQALVPRLLELNCYVTCVDPRRDWIERLPQHPRLKLLCVENPTEIVQQLPLDTFFVLISRGHAADLPVLAEVLSTRDAPYVGVIGSRLKANSLRRNLEELGIPASKREQFHCPIGLPMGNNTPAEIAISILAQLLQERDHFQAT